MSTGTAWNAYSGVMITTAVLVWLSVSSLTLPLVSGGGIDARRGQGLHLQSLDPGTAHATDLQDIGW